MNYREGPSGWKLTRMEDVCELRKEAINPAECSNMHYVGLEHIDTGNPKLKRNGNSSEVNSSKSRFYPGDILYGKLRPYLDKSVLVDFEGLCSTDILVLKSKKSISPQFLVNLIHTNQFLSYAISTSNGVNHPRTSWSSLSAFQFLLPPIPEQRAIARALRVVQGAREARLREVALERERKAALMEHLFTKGTRGEATKQTEIGEMPESWNLSTIDELKAPFKGSLVAGPFGSNIGKRFFVKSGIPVIRGNNLTKGEKYFIDDGFVFITDEKADELRSCVSLANDLIFTAAGTLGQIGIIPIDCEYDKYIISNKQIRLRVNNLILVPLFLFYWISTSTMQYIIKRENSGTSIPVLNLGVVKRLPVPLPGIPEQKEMCNYIQIIDSEIAALEHEARLHHELFRAMLEELMSGRLQAGALVEEAA